MKTINVKNPWPIGLVIFLSLFGAYIIGFVVFASCQRMDLVRADYYDQEIRFQQQIDRVQRTSPIMTAAAVNYDIGRGVVTVSLPSSVKSGGVSGTINLYRPSDAGMDKDVELAPDASGVQSVDVNALRAGLWKVRVQWKAGSQDYYFEKPVVIGLAKRS